MKDERVSKESLSSHLLAWLAVSASLIGFGQLSMGMCFGYGSLSTWTIAWGVLALSCANGVNGDALGDDVAVDPTR